MKYLAPQGCYKYLKLNKMFKIIGMSINFNSDKRETRKSLCDCPSNFLFPLKMIKKLINAY